MKKLLITLGLTAGLALGGCTLIVDTAKTTAEVAKSVTSLQEHKAEAKAHIEATYTTLTPSEKRSVTEAVDVLDKLTGQLSELRDKETLKDLIDKPEIIAERYEDALSAYIKIREVAVKTWDIMPPEARTALINYEKEAVVLQGAAIKLIEKGDTLAVLSNVIKIAKLAAKTAKYL